MFCFLGILPFMEAQVETGLIPFLLPISRLIPLLQPHPSDADQLAGLFRCFIRWRCFSHSFLQRLVDQNVDQAHPARGAVALGRINAVRMIAGRKIAAQLAQLVDRQIGAQGQFICQEPVEVLRHLAGTFLRINLGQLSNWHECRGAQQIVDRLLDLRVGRTILMMGRMRRLILVNARPQRGLEDLRKRAVGSRTGSLHGLNTTKHSPPASAAIIAST